VALRKKDMQAAEEFWMSLAEERAHLTADSTRHKVEQESTWCQEEKSSILIATAQKIWLCAKSHWWWTPEINDSRLVVGRDNK
jgi:hypothetical protein